METKLSGHAPEIDTGPASHFPDPNLLSPSGSLMEAIWDTFFALATVTAIYAGTAALAAHLNEAQMARNAGVETGKQVSLIPSARSASAVADAQTTSHFD